MNNRNIEVGCLVILIKASMENDSDVGRVGTVLSNDPFDQKTPWEVYFPGGVHGRFSPQESLSFSDIPVWLSSGAIIRIDNHDERIDEKRCDTDKTLESLK